MKTLMLFFAIVVVASAEPRTVSLTGTLTNTTGDVTAPAGLEITQDGEKLSARLVTSPPLTGTGTLAGRCLEGWCELSGSLDGGFNVKFRGVLNAREFRGTYIVMPSQGQTQYGRFDFSLVAPASK